MEDNCVMREVAHREWNDGRFSLRIAVMADDGGPVCLLYTLTCPDLATVTSVWIGTPERLAELIELRDESLRQDMSVLKLPNATIGVHGEGPTPNPLPQTANDEFPVPDDVIDDIIAALAAPAA